MLKVKFTSPAAVILVGEYVPSGTGQDAIDETQRMREMFWRALTIPGLVRVRYLMGQKDDPVFNVKYLVQIKPGDIVVFLNPTTDVSLSRYASKYIALIDSVRRIVGQKNMVLAIQDLALKERLCAGHMFGTSISYEPLFRYQDEIEVAVAQQPAPEEAISIVVSLLMQRKS